MAKGRNKSKRKAKRVDPDAKKAEIEAAKAEEADETSEEEEDEPTSEAEEDRDADQEEDSDDDFEDDEDEDESGDEPAAAKSLADLSPAERRAERRRRRIERRARERAQAAGDEPAGEAPEPTEVNTTGGLVFVGVILALLAAAVVVAFLTK